MEKDNSLEEKISQEIIDMFAQIIAKNLYEQSLKQYRKNFTEHNIDEK